MSTRFLLFTLAALNAATGLVVAVVMVPAAFGTDANFYRLTAQRLLDGAANPGLMYPPPEAVVALPLAFLSPLGTALALPAVAVVALALGVRAETQGLATIDRWLILVACLGFAPVVLELTLGQTTLLIAGAFYPALRGPDAARRGILAGLALALAPKPLVLPVLVWMLVYRRRALVGALTTAALVTGASAVALGPDSYMAWLAAMAGVVGQSLAGTLPFAMGQNNSLWPLNPARVLTAVIVAVAAGWTILRDPDAGLVAALLAGVLLAPYSVLYALSILLLAVRPAFVRAPRATWLLAFAANPCVALAPLGIPWALTALAVTLPRPRWMEATGLFAART